MTRFIFNETSYFGWGARESLTKEIKDRGFKKALLVTDETIMNVGITGKVSDLLDKEQLEYIIFNEVKPNPTIAQVKRGLKICKKYHCDYILAVGGGSVIDTAKAIGIVMNNPEYKDIKSLSGLSETNNRSLPIIALPTTFGSAAEATINYIITDSSEAVKMVCVNSKSIPVLSIIDSELMSGMPASVAAATGMDALTHAMECYITKAHNEMSDMFALKAMNLIYNNLESAVNKDKEAIEKMAYAEYIAGMGFSNAGLGIVHSMAHQLGAMYDTPHGVANGLLLPYILKWNGEVCQKRFKDMGIALGLDVEDINGMEVVTKVSDAIKDLADRLDVPNHIKLVGGKEADIPVLAKKAFNDPCTMGNPRNTSVEEFEELFKIAF